MTYGAGDLREVTTELSSGGLSRPVHFRRSIDGHLRKAWIGPALSWRQPRPRQHAKRAGISFEKKVSAELSRLYPKLFINQICFEFEDGGVFRLGRRKSVFIDGLLFNADFASVTLIEIKLRHSADAFHQLWNFYRPIVQKAWPKTEINVLEICRWYDPEVKLPKPVSFVQAPHLAGQTRLCFHPVFIQRLT